MQSLLTNPLLWIGNKEVIEFAGKSIIQWYRQQNISEHLKFLSRSAEVTISEDDRASLAKKISAGEVSLEALNTAYLLIQTENIKDCKHALAYMEKILSDETNHLYKLTLALVSRPNITGLSEIRREIFKAAISNVNQQQFSEIFTDFTLVDKELLDEEVIDYIVDKSKGGENLDVIEASIKNLVGLPVDKLAQRISLLESFFHLITVYGSHHPVTYKRIRRFVMRILCFRQITRSKCGSCKNSYESA